MTASAFYLFIIFYFSIFLSHPTLAIAPFDQSAPEPILFEDFSYYEQFIIKNINQTIDQSEIKPINIYFQSSSLPNGAGPISLGEALILNQNDPGTIFTEIAIHNQPAGAISLHWLTSSHLAMLFLQGFLYQNDWAFFAPDFLRKRYPFFFKPEAKIERFSLVWHNLNAFLSVKSNIQFVKNLQNIIQYFQSLDPQINSLKLNGALTRFGISKNDKSIFILNLKYQFNDQIYCEQNLRTDINPYSDDTQHLQNRIHCRGINYPHLKTPSSPR